MMKKYLNITLYIILYVVILAGLVMSIAISWWNYVKVDFLSKNFNFSSLLAFGLVLLAYSLIMKKRKMNLIKVCNFSKISMKNFIIVALLGIVMGIFTCSIINTSLVINHFGLLRDYIAEVETGSSSMLVYIITLTIIFIFEEMIFRGTMFNEVRRGVSLYWAIFISASIYGLLNMLTQGVIVGIYAYISSILFTLAYVYLRSLWASITLQAASMYLITLVRKTDVWNQLLNLGDGVLTIICVACVFLMISAYYLMYKEFKNSGNVKNVSQVM